MITPATPAAPRATEAMREALEQIAAFSDGGLNIGMSNTCGKLNIIARAALAHAEGRT